MAAITSNDDVLGDIRTMFGQVPKWLEVMPEQGLKGFWGLMRDFYLAETNIPNKYKELIGIAISGATRCKYCALFHTEAAKLFGATDAEIAEASLMGGVTMCASTFLNAQQIDYDEFKKETHEIVAYIRQQQGAVQPMARAAHA